MTAGKVTGLAARGQLQPALRLLERRLALSSDGRRFKGPPLRERRSGAATWKRLSELPAEDTAAEEAMAEDTMVEDTMAEDAMAEDTMAEANIPPVQLSATARV